jgi:hypothetical protein
MKRFVPILMALALCTLSAPAAQAASNVPQVAAPCASQGSCAYCGTGGIGTGACTKANLEYNVGWCARNKNNLQGNGPKCNTESKWLWNFHGFSWGNALCAASYIGAIAALGAGVGVVWEAGSYFYYAASVVSGSSAAYGIYRSC